jgi:hypothetical protein
MSIISLFLAQIIGVYLVFIGLVLLTRYNELRHIVIEAFNNRVIIFVGGIFTLSVGLIIVLIHNTWEASPAVIITILGWLTVLKSLLYLFLPQRTLARLAQFINNRAIYVIGGILSLFVGTYLAAIGFGVL